MLMNSVPIVLKKISFMKRFLLLSLLFLATGQAAFCYENDGTVQVPTMDPQLIQIDDPIFVNHGFFGVDLSLYQSGLEAPIFYETTSTRNVTNTGTMAGTPGFDFENFPASVGQAHMLDNWINVANGSSGGVVAATNLFFGANIFQGNGTFGGTFNWDLPGFATVKVRATNIVDSGLIATDSTGLIDILGQEVNLNQARFLMSGPGGVNVLDYGGGGFGTNSSGWDPAADLQPTFAISPPIYTNITGVIEEMILNNSTPYFQNLTPPTANSNIVWRVVFLQDNSPSNVTANVFFGNSGFDDGAFHVQWTGYFRDPYTGGLVTNYFVLSDDPAARRGPFFFDPAFPLGVPPGDFTFSQGPTPFFGGTPATAGYNPAPFAPTSVTNDFTFVSGQPTALSVSTNQIVGGNVTNLPGRVQLRSLGSLNLANAHILGDNYVRLNAPVNYLGNSNSMIGAPYADLNLGVTNGSLTISNLLSPQLPGWTGVPGAPAAIFGIAPMSGIEAFSGSYFFIDANGVTNDVRILMINSALQPNFAALQKDVKFHAPDNLVISDSMVIYNSFQSDTTTLTVTTNANSSYALIGALNLLSQDIFFSASLPNLQYLTNYGQIETRNLAYFAGNMSNPLSPRSGATPYQSFVNYGMITNQGIFVFAKTFVNSGLIQEGPSGNLDVIASTLTATNGSLLATNGAVSFTGDSLFFSNNIINAGRSLTFAPSCSLSDGYVLGNMFGHATNATLPVLVTNGNFFTVNGGVQVPVTIKPATADLLGTTITNNSMNSLDSLNQWAGVDRGPIPLGFADNLAVGRMIFVTDGNPSRFTFRGVNGSNALYVDSIELKGGATNTDVNGNYTSFNFEPGMKVYYAQALANGVSIAEKLNGKNGGGFMWVSNYAGIYSSTNLVYPDGNTYIFNEPLVISPDIDTDGDGIVNRDDQTPIPAGLMFDITVVGPQPCGGGGDTGGGGGNGGGTNNSHTAPGTLAFPAHQTQGGGSGGVSFALAQGSYNGLFYETNGVNPAHAGFFSAKLTKQGSFSGNLQLGGKTYPVGKAAFNSSGDFSGLVTAKGSTTPLKVTLHLLNNDQIVGQVSSGTNWTAQLLAVIEASGSVSKNSLVLSADNQSSTTVSGDSFGTMSLSKNGAIKWTGVLPDGLKISQKSALSKGGIWPMYSSLYGGSGALIGWLQVTNGDTEIGGSAVWIVPANQNALYPNGLTNKLNATGSSVDNSAAPSQGMVVLSGPQLSAPLTNHVTISGKTGQNSDKSMTLSMDVKNGLFNGQLIDSNSGQTLSFQGALLEKSGTGGGFFLNANKDQGGKVSLAPAN
jgi:hypothetical protein